MEDLRPGMGGVKGILVAHCPERGKEANWWESCEMNDRR